LIATAIRDYDYVKKKSRCNSEKEKRHWNAFNGFFPGIKHDDIVYRSFEDDTNTDVLRDGLRRRLHRALSYSKQERLEQVEEYYIHKSAPDRISILVHGLARFIIAFISGASLIVPMVVMSLHKSLTKSLITTSIAVLLFAAFASLIQAQNSEIITATAAYAAVLVVFVGVSNS
jgi:hypothetical protein